MNRTQDNQIREYKELLARARTIEVIQIDYFCYNGDFIVRT